MASLILLSDIIEMLFIKISCFFSSEEISKKQFPFYFPCSLMSRNNNMISVIDLSLWATTLTAAIES